MRGEPGNPGPPRTCTFTPAVPLPEASCQTLGTHSWQPWEFPSAKLAQPVTAPPRGYDKPAQPLPDPGAADAAPFHGGCVLSQELRVVTLRQHGEDLDRVIRIINWMRSHSQLRSVPAQDCCPR